ncbi:hypothetical protein HanRHA438_Chr14g0645951 [Helianthus annuus]|nr:hypothetical protein HanIR_Chr14g0689341 [Helianthus annuus]KAJ0852982.1 hypothetical protein HanRHA438_Chr14g0645951 [Helianthus annuus]
MQQKTKSRRVFVSVVVAGDVPVRMTGVTGEHTAWLLVVIKRAVEKGCDVTFITDFASTLIGLLVIRGDRCRCVKKRAEKSVKAGGLWIRFVWQGEKTLEAGGFVFLVGGEEPLEQG